jgi:Na+/H+-dicarboxylate symporter
MFRKMPIIFGALIVASIFVGNYLPMEIKEFLYSISISVKSIIICLLPLIIFGLLFRTAVTLSAKASWIVGLILACVCLSNFVSTFLSHFVGMWIYGMDHTIIIPKESSTLQALWDWELPKLIANDKAMLFGIISGFLCSLINKRLANQLSEQLEGIVTKLLTLFTYVIPLFILGFIIKLQNDGVILNILNDYTLIFSVVAFSQFGYILTGYFILNKGNSRSFFNCLKNMLPAALSGFSTMSSAAAMPLTILGVQNNTNNKELAKSVVPATVNIHLVGDCFAIPIFAYAVLKNYGIAEPAFYDFLIFAVYFVIAKFSVAAIPGGGIIVMLPILESQLGFNAEMMSLITALYILFDPIITSANVLGNGAFAKMIDSLVTFIHSWRTPLISVTEEEGK